MIEMSTRTLMKSLYDGDMNQITLIFEDGDKRVMATGKDPECNYNNELYFDNEENINAFLTDLDTEIEVI